MISIVNLAAVVLMLLLLVPATARLTRLVTRDSITSPMREAIYAKWGTESFLARLIECHWCSGVWTAGLTSIPTWVITWDLMPGWGALTKTWMWALTILAVAYTNSRMIDRED